jgi:hypothetical protein
MSRTYELIQDRCKPGEFSPSAGRWHFQIVNADGHICQTSRAVYASPKEAEIAAREALTQGQEA